MRAQLPHHCKTERPRELKAPRITKQRVPEPNGIRQLKLPREQCRDPTQGKELRRQPLPLQQRCERWIVTAQLYLQVCEAALDAALGVIELLHEVVAHLP